MTGPVPGSLAAVEHWMFQRLTHPDTESAPADQVIRPGASLDPEQRLGIYAGMYEVRLVGALAQDHPGLRHALGAERFRALARRFVADHPSTVASLNDYGREFPDWLDRHPPEDPDARFLVELAQMERAQVECFHARVDGRLGADERKALDPAALMGLRLVPVAATRLLRFEHPVAAYRDAVDAGEDPPRPAAATTHVLLARPRYTVLRRTLDAEAATLLQALFSGHTLGEALEHLLATPGREPEAVMAVLGTWFEEWGGLGLFQPLSLPQDPRPEP